MLRLRDIDGVDNIVSQGAWLFHRVERVTGAIGEEGSHDGGGRLVADEDTVSILSMDLLLFLSSLFIIGHTVFLDTANLPEGYRTWRHCIREHGKEHPEGRS